MVYSAPSTIENSIITTTLMSITLTNVPGKEAYNVIANSFESMIAKVISSKLKHKKKETIKKHIQIDYEDQDPVKCKTCDTQISYNNTN